MLGTKVNQMVPWLPWVADMSNSIEPGIDIDFLGGIGIGIDIDYCSIQTIDIGIDIDFSSF